MSAVFCLCLYFQPLLVIELSDPSVDGDSQPGLRIYFADGVACLPAL